MKLEYLHRSGGNCLSAPSGTIYEFTEDADGRRMAEVKDARDAEWFLTLRNSMGQPLFAALAKPRPKTKPEPADKPVDTQPAVADEPTDPEPSLDVAGHALEGLSE